MERKIIQTVLVLAALAAAGIHGCYYGDFRETVYGNGNVTKESVDIDGFNGIHVSSGIDVYIRQGSPTEITVEADENLHEHIRVELRDRTLDIGTYANIRQARSKKVYVTLPELRKVNVSSAGDVRGQGQFTCDRLDISISSAGDLYLEVEADEIHCSLSSSGDAELTGKARLLEARISSAGDLKAFDLEVEKCRVSASSSGDARVFVTGELDASASSSGDIYYRGDPELRNIRTSSSGKIYAR